MVQIIKRSAIEIKFNNSGQDTGKKHVRSNSAPDLVSSKFCLILIYNSFILSIVGALQGSTDLRPTSSLTERDADAPLPSAAAAYDVLDSILDDTRNFASTSTTSPQSASPPPSGDSDKSLSAVEAIVSKYLSPKNTTVRTTKKVIKRPYGVSVTDLDVAGENAIAQQKKNTKENKKRPSTSRNLETLTKAKRAKTSFQLTSPTSFSAASTSTTISASRSSTDNSTAYSQQSNCYVPPPQYYPPTNPCYQQYFQYPRSSTLEPLQNTTNSLSSCGRCYQQFNNLNLGGRCAQCQKSLCWTCCANDVYGIFYCNKCRSINSSGSN